MKLFAGRTQGTSGVSYETQREWTKKLLDAGGLTNMGKKTHLGRAEGAKFADVAGVDESHVRRAGHWRSDALTRSYLTNLPRPFMRAMAGFKQESSDSYWLPRAATEVPYSVERKLLPWVDPWLDWHEGRIDHPPVDDGRGDNRNDDLAAVNSLRLLQFLRKVFIQDSTVLRAKYPTHPVFKISLFKNSGIPRIRGASTGKRSGSEKGPSVEQYGSQLTEVSAIIRPALLHPGMLHPPMRGSLFVVSCYFVRSRSVMESWQGDISPRLSAPSSVHYPVSVFSCVLRSYSVFSFSSVPPYTCTVDSPTVA